jgi:hypothetical protein
MFLQDNLFYNNIYDAIDIFQKVPTSVYLPGSLMDNYYGCNIVVLNGEVCFAMTLFNHPLF